VKYDVIWRVNEDIVHINGDVAFVDQIAKYEIHHGLKCGGSIREAEEHDHGLEKAAIRLEGGFPLITISNAYVVISPPDV
jgi:hypothetical protein